MDKGKAGADEFLYRALVEQEQTYAIMMLDPEGCVTVWNHEAEQVFGWSKDEIIGCSGAVIFTEEDQQQGTPAKELRKALETGKAVDDRWHVRKDGSRIWMNGSVTPVRDDEGELLGFAKIVRDRTQHKALEEQLNQREAHYHFTLRNTNTCTWERDFVNDRIYWSEETYALFGFPPDIEPSHELWESRLHPDDLERERELTASIPTSGQTTFDDEFRIIHPERGIRWLLSRGFIEHDAEGEPIRMVGLNSDITARKLAEEQARRSSRRVEQLLESITDAFFAVDNEWRFTYLNRHAELLLERKKEELLGKVIWDEFSEAIGMPFYGETHRAVQERRAVDFTEYYPPLKRWFEVSAYPYENGLSVFFADVTQRKELEEERERLLAAEQHARRATENANRRLQFLARASTLLASSLDYEMTLKRLSELCVPAMADWCIIDVLTDEGELERVSVVHSDPAKTAWAQEYQWRFPPKPDGAEGAYKVLRTGKSAFYPQVPDEALQAVARDQEHLEVLRQLGFSSVIIAPLATRERTVGALTLVYAESGRTYTPEDLLFAEELARRAAIAVENAGLYEELEVRVEERTHQLEQVNRELEAFSYSVSHDLRAPLRGMMGFSQALLEDYGDRLDENGVRYLQRITASGERMGTLIDGLLVLSRLSRVELHHTTVNLSEIAHELLGELQRAEPQREVTTHVQDDLMAEGDERLLRQVMQNLLENAWKFTRNQEQAVIEVGKDNGTFFVRDNGAGFDMAYANKLFGAFQRLHPVAEFEGTGIGLALVKRIINRHGGNIWAEAKEGTGATFFFTLPEDEDETTEP